MNRLRQASDCAAHNGPTRWLSRGYQQFPQPPGAACALIIALLLTGCAGALPWNLQNYAGINYVEFKRCADEERICYLKVISGKEGPLQVEYVKQDGSHVILRSDYKAFEAQKFRAELETAIAEEFGDAAPAIAEAVTSAVMRGVVPLQ